MKLKYNYAALVKIEQEKGTVEAFFNGLQSEDSAFMSDIAYLVSIGMNISFEEAIEEIDAFIEECEGNPIEELTSIINDAFEKSKFFNMGKQKAPNTTKKAKK